MACAMFFYDFRQDQQNYRSLISSILQQLTLRSQEATGILLNLYEKHNKGERRVSDKDLTAILRSVVESFDRVYIIVDALDECNSGRTRRELLSGLQVIAQWELLPLQLLFTSRREHDITTRLLPLCESSNIDLNSRNMSVNEDIVFYVRAFLEREDEFKSIPNSHKEEILECLGRGCDGM